MMMFFFKSIHTFSASFKIPFISPSTLSCFPSLFDSATTSAPLKDRKVQISSFHGLRSGSAMPSPFLHCWILARIGMWGKKLIVRIVRGEKERQHVSKTHCVFKLHFHFWFSKCFSLMKNPNPFFCSALPLHRPFQYRSLNLLLCYLMQLNLSLLDTFRY